MEIAVFEIENWERPHFEALARDHRIRFIAQPLTPANAADFRDAQIISTFIYSDLGAATLDAFADLRLIATRSTGFDHIDLPTCHAKGTAVCNVPRYGKNTVAEHVFALLLTISHRMEEAIARTRRGDFSPRGLEGFDLLGKTLGVVGTGDIGKAAVRIAKGFGMNVLAFDTKPDAVAARDMGFRYVTLPELLRESDVVTLHVPANEHTRDMISHEQFEQMKHGAVLINTARGSVVDLCAMARALADGKLAAAGLDVLPEEPVIREEAELLRSVYERRHDLGALLADQVLTRMRNVIVTPHSAFNTREAVERLLDTTVENIRSFVAGHPTNLVGDDSALND